MTQDKNINQVITMQDVCDRFGISRRYCRALIRRGVIECKPRKFYKVKLKDERRAVDWFLSRAEWRRLEREGLVAPDQFETDTKGGAQ